MMKYTELLPGEYHDEYIKIHRIIYLSLMKIGAEISFLQTLYKWQEEGLKEFNPAISFVYNETKDAMVTRINSVFFDTGSDTANLNRLKNLVFQRCKSEYKAEIIRRTSECFNDYESKKKKCIGIKVLRNHFTAHNLLLEAPEVEVSFDKIDALVIAGCNLFHSLSYEVASAYPFSFGYRDSVEIYSKERDAIKRYTEEFLENQVLSSIYVQQVECKYKKIDPQSLEITELKKRQDIIERINHRKK